MPYVPFHTLCPQTAKRETRSIITLSDDSSPKGEFGFMEMFCDECDCRRAIIRVLSPDAGPEGLANISYGWGTRSFYIRWFGGREDEEMLQSMMGASLQSMAPQCTGADCFLKLFRDILQNDPAYEMRIRRHYSQFRKKLKKNGAGNALR